jgi:hypothetical protein
MNEATWDACATPLPMLEFLRGKASERKLRLFAVACCRRIGSFIKDSKARDALAVAECFADGLVSDTQRSQARKAAQQAAQSRGVTRIPTAPKWERRAASAVYWAAARSATDAAWNAPVLAVDVLVWQAGGYSSCNILALMKTEQRAQADVLRDAFGNPFRPLPSVEEFRRPTTVLGLAKAVYEEGRFADVPVLADALEETGCTDAEILAHLRGPGPHVRGCWVIDLLLGKE